MTKKQTGTDGTKEQEVSVDFGERKINTQNFSKTVVLPKTALTGCGCNLEDNLKVNVQLVQKGDERYIKLIPVCNPDLEKINKEVKQ